MEKLLLDIYAYIVLPSSLNIENYFYKKSIEKWLIFSLCLNTCKKFPGEVVITPPSSSDPVERERERGKLEWHIWLHTVWQRPHQTSEWHWKKVVFW